MAMIWRRMAVVKLEAVQELAQKEVVNGAEGVELVAAATAVVVQDLTAETGVEIGT